MSDFSLENLICHRDNLENVLDNLKEGIIAHDMDRRIFFFNTEAERITGYHREEVLNRDCHEAFGSPFCGERCVFCEDPPKLAEKSEYTLNISTKTGEKRRVEMTVTSMRDADGQNAGVLTSFTDVTDIFSLKERAGELTSFGNIIGHDSKMISVFKQIKDVADYDYAVHISGETGTGKELVAEAIHSESWRGGAPFVPINCGALPEGLIESELFGHVKGAFTGAFRDKKGRFELADAGTAFLDEVTELSNTMQAKLLRFLQEGKFERVGGEQTIRVDVRVISATNKNLKEAVKRGRFREDLYYRLNVIPIELPPLRDRKIDLPLLSEHFLQEARERYGKKRLKISNKAMSLMLDYRWPGNVRELQNAIQFAIVKSSSRVISPDDLPLELRDLENICVRRGPSRKLDVDSVRSALERSGGNKVKAAKLLGVGRATLYRFLGDHPDLLETVNLPF
ncbi:MAG: sigma 54-interacting transcriptional regulator [Desulfobacterales bacterium]|nr:sigma 54-interacting transcriptional regulator [Desulfobacterales bacterium]MCK5418026.1 sigma 54-interacting transcriptional regulator [Desulfobacterales bacterium]MCK5487544.1 sigma 54-interacting transcriptional regulator [Desulfobacterales bacterium]